MKKLAFKCTVIALTITVHTVSFGMMTAYNAMPNSYKKAHSSPLGNKKKLIDSKVTCRYIKDKGKAEEDMTSLFLLPDDILLKLCQEHGVGKDLPKTCKFMQNLYIDPTVKQKLADVRDKIGCLLRCSTINDGWLTHDDLNNAMDYVLRFDDDQLFKELLGVAKTDIRKRYEWNVSRFYTFYRDTLEKAIACKSIKCFKQAIQKEPLQIKNYCYKNPTLIYDLGLTLMPIIEENEEKQGPILYDLQQYSAKNNDSACFFFNQLKKFCEDNGCKSREQILNENQAIMDSVIANPELVQNIAKNAGVRRVSNCGSEFSFEKDESVALAMRATCKAMHRAIKSPQLENAKAGSNSSSWFSQWCTLL